MVSVLHELSAAMNTYGPVIVILLAGVLVNGFFIWRDWKREQRYQSQIEKLEKKFEDSVLPIVAEYKVLVTECKGVIAEATECIRQNSRVIERLIDRERR